MASLYPLLKSSMNHFHKNKHRDDKNVKDTTTMDSTAPPNIIFSIRLLGFKIHVIYIISIN